MSGDPRVVQDWVFWFVMELTLMPSVSLPNLVILRQCLECLCTLAWKGTVPSPLLSKHPASHCRHLDGVQVSRQRVERENTEVRTSCKTPACTSFCKFCVYLRYKSASAVPFHTLVCSAWATRVSDISLQWLLVWQPGPDGPHIQVISRSMMPGSAALVFVSDRLPYVVKMYLGEWPFIGFSWLHSAV